jgi:serine-type D-Ala-D-Ala carboxypeptidase (penicillin-binding protein 5/6)
MSTAPPHRSAAPRPHPTGFLRAGVPPDFPTVHRRSRRRRRLVRTLLVAAAVLVVILLLVTGGGGGAGGGGAAATSPPGVSVRATLATTATVPVPATTQGALAPAGLAAIAPSLPWPVGGGQAAVSIPDLGYLAESAPEKAVPVASLTKIMTAYVILRDHPLPFGAKGPTISITTADADNFGMDTVTDQASVELKAGEVLTEYQLLEGLLVHSANDFAYVLATWDAGSVNAFVTKMNAAARALGMSGSRFADASGFDPGSMSTAEDMVRLTSAAMEEPAFAAIVQMPSVTLPVAGTVESYTPLVGTTPGVVGVKSGFTSAAGGSDVLAYMTTLGGTPFVTIAAVTSLEGPTVLDTAGKDALALAKAAASHVAPYTVTASHRRVGWVTVTGHKVAATTASSATLLAIGGDVVHQSVVLRRPTAAARAGTTVGTASFRVGAQVVSVPVETASRLP